MLRPALLALLAAPALAGPALAQPVVVADTAPVHSLVAQVMAGAGEPALLLPEGEPPHGSSLRPSAARALAEADVVVWTGPALLPWMEDALESLAPDARALALLDTDGWTPLPPREAGPLLADEENHAGTEYGEQGPDEQGHEAIDPHAWLDPGVVAVWAEHVADALAAADPPNAALYRANAAGAASRLEAQGDALRARLAPLDGRGFAASHDALQYFERATGLPAFGAAAPAHGGAAPAAGLLELRAAAEDGRLACLLVEPGADPALVAALGEGTDLRVAPIDPEGLGLAPGPALHAGLLDGLAAALESCLG